MPKKKQPIDLTRINLEDPEQFEIARLAFHEIERQREKRSRSGDRVLKTIEKFIAVMDEPEAALAAVMQLSARKRTKLHEGIRDTNDFLAIVDRDYHRPV